MAIVKIYQGKLITTMMKKMFLCTASLTITLSACAQKMNEKDVPQTVKNSFNNDFPGKTNVKWETTGSDYEAKYKNSSEDIMAKYDKNGNAIEREEKVQFAVLPENAKTYCNNNLPGKTVAESYKVTDKNGNVLYDAVVEETEYVFDSDGNYKSKKPKKNRK
jgi:outer membrane lipoprotein-sorting protein